MTRALSVDVVALPAAAARHQDDARAADGRDDGDGRRRHDGHPRAARSRRARAEHHAPLAHHGRSRCVRTRCGNIGCLLVARHDEKQVLLHVYMSICQCC